MSSGFWCFIIIRLTWWWWWCWSWIDVTDGSDWRHWRSTRRFEESPSQSGSPLLVNIYSGTTQNQKRKLAMNSRATVEEQIRATSETGNDTVGRYNQHVWKMSFSFSCACGGGWGSREVEGVPLLKEEEADEVEKKRTKHILFSLLFSSLWERRYSFDSYCLHSWGVVDSSGQ